MPLEFLHFSRPSLDLAHLCPVLADMGRPSLVTDRKLTAGSDSVTQGAVRNAVLEGAIFVVGFVLLECVLHALNQRSGVEFCADDFVGTVAVYGHAVIADKGDVL